MLAHLPRVGRTLDAPRQQNVRHERPQPPSLQPRSRTGFGSITIEVLRHAPNLRARHQAPEGSLWFIIARQGELKIEHANEAVTLGPRAAAFLSGAAHVFQTGAAGSETIRISFPVEIAQDSPWLQSGTTGIAAVPETSLLIAPTAAFIGQALAESARPRRSSVGVYYAERLLQEMLQGLLVDVDQVRAVPHTPEVYALAISVISAQCTDPEFSASRVAESVNLSLRQLERIFRRNGTSIARAIRRARIDTAITLLTTPAHDALGIDQIATYVGFGSGSSLARAMAAEGEPSPSKVRANRR